MVWEENNMKNWIEIGEHNRPEPITFNILKDEEAVNLVKELAATDWEYLFANQQEYNELMQDYKEQTSEIVRPPNYDYAVFSNYNPIEVQIETEIRGEKIWLDDESLNRPESIIVYLVANEEVVDKKTVTSQDDWRYTFTNIPLYDGAGEKIDYKIREQSIPGYLTSYEGYNIKNIRSEQTEARVKKIWRMQYPEQQPESVRVTLFQNDKKLKQIQLLKQNNWEYHFKELEVFDAKGEAYQYRIEEDDRMKDLINPIKFKMGSGKFLEEEQAWSIGVAVAGGVLLLLGLAAKLRNKDE